MRLRSMDPTRRVIAGLTCSLGVVLRYLLNGREGKNKFGDCNMEIIAGEDVCFVEKQDLIVMDLDAQTHAYLHDQTTKTSGAQAIVWSYNRGRPFKKNKAANHFIG